MRTGENPMRHFGGFSLALLTVTGLCAQGNGITHSPVVTSGFGTLSHPGAAAPIRPYRNPGGYNSPRAAAPVYAYPVYVGGYGYPGSGYSGYQDAYAQDDSGAAAAAQPPQQQAAQPITIVYPPQQTIIVNQYPSPDGGPPVISMQQGPPAVYQGPPPPARRPAPAPVADDTDTTPEAPHYLIAFKDHTIYSAMAYWVDGDTLHYFTNGNTHNQASLSLVDRDLTERLNHEAGVDLKLPPPSTAAK